MDNPYDASGKRDPEFPKNRCRKWTSNYLNLIRKFNHEKVGISEDDLGLPQLEAALQLPAKSNRDKELCDSVHQSILTLLTHLEEYILTDLEPDTSIAAFKVQYWKEITEIRFLRDHINQIRNNWAASLRAVAAGSANSWYYRHTDEGERFQDALQVSVDLLRLDINPVKLWKPSFDESSESSGHNAHGNLSLSLSNLSLSKMIRNLYQETTENGYLDAAATLINKLSYLGMPDEYFNLLVTPIASDFSVRFGIKGTLCLDGPNWKTDIVVQDVLLRAGPKLGKFYREFRKRINRTTTVFEMEDISNNELREKKWKEGLARLEQLRPQIGPDDPWYLAFMSLQVFCNEKLADEGSEFNQRILELSQEVDRQMGTQYLILSPTHAASALERLGRFEEAIGVLRSYRANTLFIRSLYPYYEAGMTKTGLCERELKLKEQALAALGPDVNPEIRTHYQEVITGLRNIHAHMVARDNKHREEQIKKLVLRYSQETSEVEVKVKTPSEEATPASTQPQKQEQKVTDKPDSVLCGAKKIESQEQSPLHVDAVMEEDERLVGYPKRATSFYFNPTTNTYHAGNEEIIAVKSKPKTHKVGRLPASKENLRFHKPANTPMNLTVLPPAHQEELDTIACDSNKSIAAEDSAWYEHYFEGSSESGKLHLKLFESYLTNPKVLKGMKVTPESVKNLFSTLQKNIKDKPTRQDQTGDHLILRFNFQPPAAGEPTGKKVKQWGEKTLPLVASKEDNWLKPYQIREVLSILYREGMVPPSIKRTLDANKRNCF